MRTVVLSGFLGTGKTTLGPRVAASLGVPFLDTDQELAKRAGLSVAHLWRTLGEAAFREREDRLVREILGDGVERVVSFGGGTVTNRELRRFTLERATVVTLTAPPSVILARIPDFAERPTLSAEDPLARITSLLEQRRGAYGECHFSVNTDRLPPAEAAAMIVGQRRDSTIVPFGERSYAVDVVNDAHRLLTEVLDRLAPSSLLVVTDRQIRAARGHALDEILRPLAIASREVLLEPGEEHKTLASVQRIWDGALHAGMDRNGVVLGFGGGVVGDLAGFAASTLFRGIRFVLAPTTLLAMVDASVGGKTGFDVPSGKNLIGSFHQPSGVVADVSHLATLPRRDFVSGLAEVAKIALACDADLWDELEDCAEALRVGEPSALTPAVRRAIALKARVVADDERDEGGRMRLNLGHTVGHALEAAGGYTRYRHGEAVALGLIVETEAAERLGRAARGLSARVRALLARLGLPTEVPALADAWPHVALDKKRTGSLVALPLPTRIGHAPPESVSLREFARALGVTDAG